MAFQDNECGVPRIIKNMYYSTCKRPLVDGCACEEHRGFYEPSRWLAWLDKRTQGHVYPPSKRETTSYTHSYDWKEDLYYEHMVCALKKRVRITQESLKVLPTYMFEENEHCGPGHFLTLFLYATQPQIRREWSPRIWRRMRNCMYRLLSVDSSEKYTRIDLDETFKTMVKTPEDLVTFVKDIHETYDWYNIWIQVGQGPRVFTRALKDHTEWAMVDAVKDAADLYDTHHSTNEIDVVKSYRKYIECEAKERFSLIRDELLSKA